MMYILMHKLPTLYKYTRLATFLDHVHHMLHSVKYPHQTLQSVMNMDTVQFFLDCNIHNAEPTVETMSTCQQYNMV